MEAAQAALDRIDDIEEEGGATEEQLGRLRELYRERDPLYREIADVVVDTARQSVQVLARGLLEQLGTRWKRSA
jgi:shikimate kinase